MPGSTTKGGDWLYLGFTGFWFDNLDGELDFFRHMGHDGVSYDVWINQTLVD